MTETDMIPCPVHGCQHRCQTPDTLLGHLWEKHSKSEVAAALVRTCMTLLGRPMPE